MKFALIGPPQSGKSTLFTAVSGQTPATSHGGQKHPIAVVKVPDPRLVWLRDLFQPKKYTPATVDLLDIPGLPLDQSNQRDQVDKLIPAIREADVLVAVVRGHSSDATVAYRDRVDPAGDLDELHAEFAFSDLELIARRIEKLEVAVTKPTKSQEADKRELALLQNCRSALEDEKPINDVIQNAEQSKLVRSFAFLTQKSWVGVVNIDESQLAAPPSVAHPADGEVIALAAKLEAELAQLDGDDRALFMEEMKLNELATERLLRVCYHAAGLISFFTVGPDEVRAWTINQGQTALEAAGKIHSDIARGFIRAETISYEQLRECGDMKAAKAAGKLRLEGKEYVVQDGEIVHFRFNV